VDTLRTLRRQLLTPSMSETKLSVRGFHVKDESAKARLERVGQSFLTGYGYAAEARNAGAADLRLRTVEPEYRGFAYEGAAMAFAVRDGLPIGGSRHFSDFLADTGSSHAYMAYIGMGWAMARLPRFRWSRFQVADPLLRWLVLDGYGFHQAYFHTDRYVHRHYQEPDFPWPAESKRWYARHAIDQGIGRALWFVGGTDVAVVTGLINGFPEERRADLFSGTGLAATYAGGVTVAELTALREAAGPCRPQLAQGAIFAATARVEAGLVTPHTGIATQVLAGITPAEAAEASRQARPQTEPDDDLPGYELWRRQLAARSEPLETA
jgi:enediyne biosynthesis protein E3